MKKPRRLPDPVAPLKVPAQAEIKEILGIPDLGAIVSAALHHIAASQDAASRVTTVERMMEDVILIATRTKDDAVRLQAYQFLLDLATAERGRKWVNTIARAKESMQTGDIPKVHIELIDRRKEGEATVVEVKEVPASPPPVEVGSAKPLRDSKAAAYMRERRAKEKQEKLEAAEARKKEFYDRSEKQRLARLAEKEKMQPLPDVIPPEAGT